MNQNEHGTIAVCIYYASRIFVEAIHMNSTWETNRMNPFRFFLGDGQKYRKSAFSCHVHLGNEEGSNDVTSSRGHIKSPVPARDCGKKKALFDHRYIPCGIRRS